MRCGFAKASEEVGLLDTNKDEDKHRYTSFCQDEDPLAYQPESPGTS